jgi:uncharacterized membrane protein YhaH (DUF805 family)
MTGYAKWAIVVSLAAAAGAVALSVAIAEAWASGGLQPMFLAFLAGPLVFLALLAWRRREHAARSKMLFHLAVILAIAGLGVLLYDFIRFRNEPNGKHVPHMHPLIVPLVQWFAVLIVWVVLVVKEGREKRAKQAVAKD